MPKGFSQKAIEGFSQWMTAMLSDTNLNQEEKRKAVDQTRNLLKEGFPQVRKY
jgi:hypothetical protein